MAFLLFHDFPRLSVGNRNALESREIGGFVGDQTPAASADVIKKSSERRQPIRFIEHVKRSIDQDDVETPIRFVPGNIGDDALR